MSKASIKQALQRKLGKKKLCYVARDIERGAAGFILDLKNYHIITNDSPYARKLKEKYQDNIEILRSSDAQILDTFKLLAHPGTLKLIKKKDYVLVFKNTPQIEKYCAEHGWKLLNPSAVLANQVEEKISQINWLGPLAKLLPKYKIDICKNISWTGKKFILQFNRSHTGSGTILITNKKQLNKLKQKFPNREARVAEYISGPLFTNNNIVWRGKIILGNISYQITGLKPFTDLPFATIGNDWALPSKILTKTQIKQYNKIATLVGKRLAKQGWKGLFGIDTVLNEQTGQLYLLEINARQPASATFEAELQQTNTVFEAHLAALLNSPYQGQKLTKIKNGSQIIQRVLINTKKKIGQKKQRKLGNLKIINYTNSKPGSDLVRMQNSGGIMKKHKVIKYD